MNRIFIAVDGDNIEQMIRDALLHDDAAQVADISSKIESAGEEIKKWALQNGGKKIAFAGDEAIFVFDDQAANNLSQEKVEELKQKYQEISGTTITIGMGFTLTQAAKALMAGKIQGKNQVSAYNSDTENVIAQAHQDEFHGDQEEAHPADEMFDDHGSFENDEMPEEGAQSIEDQDYGAPSPEGDVPEYYEDENTPQENNYDQHLIDEISSPEDTAAHYDDTESAPEEAALDMEGAQAEQEDGEDKAPMLMAEEDGQPSEEAPQEEVPEHEMLNDIMQEEPEQDLDQLKSRVASVLAAFKDQKPLLDQVAQQAPEFKEAALEMVKVMIEMGRVLFPSSEEPAPVEQNDPASGQEMASPDAPPPAAQAQETEPAPKQ